MISVAQSYIDEGIEQGISIGIVRVAKSLLAQGASIEMISEATGLSRKEIEELQRGTLKIKGFKIKQ